MGGKRAPTVKPCWPTSGRAQYGRCAYALRGSGDEETTTRAPELPRKSRGRGLPHFSAGYEHDCMKKP
eukprot:7847715-Heterocapsa_arctica.AAC.1